MTTEAAAQHYLAEYLAACRDKGWAVYNPEGKDESTLPVIYGFNNGGSMGFMSAVAIAEDGTGLGGHCCSHEGYMPGDLGILEGYRPDRHENDYKPHYPGGYRMEFVSSEDIPGHAKLNAAFALNAKMEPQS